MTNRDDMVIIPLLERSNHPRDQEVERRRTDQVIRRKRRIRNKLRKARMARRALDQKRAKRLRAAKKSSMIPSVPDSVKRKAASRMVPVVGWAMVVADLIILGGEAARRLGGQSARLVEAEDARTMYGILDEQATANNEVLQMFESDEGMLRAIGQEKKLNSSMQLLAQRMKSESLKRAMGADLIARDPYFDSADSMLDKLLMKVDNAGLRELSDDTIRKLRANGYGRIR